MLDAVFVTILLIAINSVLRPLSRFIDQRSLATLDTRTVYRLRVVCDNEYQTEAEYQVTRAIASLPLILSKLHSEKVEDTETSIVQAILEVSASDPRILETIADDLRTLPWVRSVEWTKTSAENE